MRIYLLLIFVSLSSITTVSSALVQLKLMATLQGYTQTQVQQFLATPTNWPKLVLSSWNVQGLSVDSPLKANNQVREIFGLPPVLPLCFLWICVKVTKDCLEVQSALCTTYGR